MMGEEAPTLRRLRRLPNRPPCKLIGEDGNVFGIMGRVRRALVGAGQRDRAIEFLDRVTRCHSYDEVLVLVQEFVDVE